MSHCANQEKAAMYVRMSTDHQQYSTKNQIEYIKKYAEEHHLEIVGTFADEGCSGVELKGRDEAKLLLEIINHGKAFFQHLLVYDISRWGRFQDSDEAAYYEYQIRKAGIQVHYCAESFKNDGGMLSNVSKSIKRAMAAEYSRELSAKVFQGQCNLIKLGYRQGGPVGFGLRRQLVDEEGKPKDILARGECKSIQNDRVIQVLGPAEEVEVVKWIYRMFVDKMKSEREIARVLNTKGITTDFDRQWTAATIHQILTNEKYIGNNVFNRISKKLTNKGANGHRRVIKNTPNLWVRADSVFEPVIEKEIFHIAQGIIKQRSRKFTDTELIDKLKGLYRRKGKVSGILIDEEDEMPSSAVYSNRFGSLLKVYELIGYTPDIDYSYIEINRMIRGMHTNILSEMEEEFLSHEVVITRDKHHDGIRWINGETKLAFAICRCRCLGAGRSRWVVRFERECNPDFSIIARLNPDNRTIKDYYVFTRLDMEFLDSKLEEENGFFIDIFRWDSLESFYPMFKRTKLEKTI